MWLVMSAAHRGWDSGLRHAATVGRCSLGVFLAQFFVYWSLFDPVICPTRRLGRYSCSQASLSYFGLRSFLGSTSAEPASHRWVASSVEYALTAVASRRGRFR